jgi:ribosomal protein S18 acetylase RimI-like enzyme
MASGEANSVEITFAAVDRTSAPQANALSNKLYLLEGLPMDEGRRLAMFELAEHPEFGGAWLILADESVAGYVVLTACYSLEFHGRFGLLDEFYIDERWRGKGLGTATLDFIDRECRSRGWKSVRLEVAVENLRAQELYRRSRYETERRHLLTKWL